MNILITFTRLLKIHKFTFFYENLKEMIIFCDPVISDHLKSSKKNLSKFLNIPLKTCKLLLWFYPQIKFYHSEQFFLYSSIDTIVCMFLFPENSFQHSKKCKGTVVVILSAPPLLKWHVRLTWYRFTKEAIVVFVSSLYLKIFCKSVF